MQYVSINGKLLPQGEAAIPVDNGAFRYGYGLFETLLVVNGVIMLQSLHMDRLFAGMQQLHLQLPPLVTPQKLAGDIMAVVQKNGLASLCRVRLQVYAGGGGFFGAHAQKAGYIIECFEISRDIISYNENGLHLGVAQGVKKAVDDTANYKTCNALVYALGARQAKERKWNDALICNTGGEIMESTIANVFWIKEGIIYTPPLSSGCVGGVMRHHIMSNSEVRQANLSLDILHNADEVFLTNAVRRIKWVSQIEDKMYSNTISRELASRLFKS